jgi:hypothetical protein
VVLDAGEYASYFWNTGETGRFIEVFESGTYTVSVTLPNGIIAYASPILVHVISPLAVEEIVFNASCFGASDGYIKLMVEDESLISQVSWNGQAGELVLADLPQGAYTYIIIDNFTCETQGIIFLSEPPELNVLLLSDYNQIEDTVIVSVFAFGGTPPYTLLVNDVIIQNMEQFTASIDIDLFIQLFDVNSCVAIDTLFQTSTSLSSLSAKKINTYPSPFSEKICIDIDNFSYQLFNTKGQMV